MKLKLDKTLVSNTFFLYLLTFSNNLLSLVTVPYLTRVLGPETYGKIGVALAYMSYVGIIMDLGFILSATQKVVTHKTDQAYIGRLLFSVTAAKLAVGAVVSAVFLSYVRLNSNMSGDFGFYLAYLAAYLVNAFLPDFYYRGIEKMKTITYRTVFVKALFMVMTFLFIREESDYWKVPCINLTGNTMAVIIMYTDMWRKYRVRPRLASPSEVWNHAKDTLPFFVSRIASTVYQALNTILLSFVYGSSPVLGYYTSADKLVSLSKTVSSPIADSMYPYMLRKRNFKMVKRMLTLVTPVILLGAVVFFLFAEQLCVFLFGAEYAEAGNVLRCLLPIMVVILPSYILCFPVMVPMGLSKYANMSNVVGMIVQLVGLALLFATENLHIYSLCLMASASEVSVFLFRFSVVALNWKKRAIE